jgi:hypothetical protein
MKKEEGMLATGAAAAEQAPQAALTWRVPPLGWGGTKAPPLLMPWRRRPANCS